MEEKNKIKLFISYSHNDENQVNEFIKHITPLKTNGFIADWYDRKILAGQYFKNQIDNNLEDANIICLFISANFLSSSACMKEKNDALDLHRNKGISVLPIILSSCGWLDDKDISPLLALPTDGKAISTYTDSNVAWKNVYDGLKDVIKREIKINSLKITNQFLTFLQNTDLLTNAHSKKEEVLLDDIFVYPEFIKYDVLREYDKSGSSSLILDDFSVNPKILIAGEDQSGKTSLCKKIFLELRKKYFVPIYLIDKTNQFLGNIENIIIKAYSEQYEGVDFKEISKERIVPIIDDFHFAKYKEKHIEDLSIYTHQIVIVDDIFGMNIKDENIIKSFIRYKIKEFKPSLRNELIKKWINLAENNSISINHENNIYQNLDRTTELVNSALGKIIGSGIMPSYPFFILTVISTFDTFEKPLDQEITSQGYCYQALIYLYLRKQGVKNDEIDTYINFLTEFAYYFYFKKKQELSIDEFEDFLESYLSKFNLPVESKLLIRNLLQTNIISLNNFNNYSFSYSYLFYFFVAKYFADHSEENKKIIDHILANLQKNENAYIAIFISHHSKKDYVLDEIILNALVLFEKYSPATLSKDELNFFDEQADMIVEAVFPAIESTPEKERDKLLKTQDNLELSREENIEDPKSEANEYDDLAIELRRSIKTVEVMGHIIKNRAGSLGKDRLKNVFEEGMKVHLRILTSFFQLIKDEKNQKEVVDFITSRLDLIIKEKGKVPSQESIEKISRSIFWNTNFFCVYGFIDKIIHSLGSNKLTRIIADVCDNENTPASFVVKHGILMWYNKNLQIDNIADRIETDGFSKTAKNVIKHKIVNHCSLHSIGFKEKQKIEYRLKIPSKMLLPRNSK